MDTLESQVAKIELGNPKHVNSFVYTLAEKSPVGNSELYVVAELPLLNPAAYEACKNICLTIGSTLKRSFKKFSGENAFETAIAQVNEELGKLAETGQTAWIDKLNCVLAAKDGNSFWIATCGKVVAYLYRSQNFTDISSSTPKPHPLKTFENVAFGKLKLDDIIILSTTQLFNHLSIDRFQHILQDSDFLPANEQIMEILKDNAGPEAAFGAILSLQVPYGTALEETPSSQQSYQSNASIFDKFKNIRGMLPKRLALPKLSAESFKNIGGSTRDLGNRSKELLSKVGSAVKSGSKGLSPGQIQNFSKTKKIFLASVIILILAIGAEVAVSSHLKKSKQTQSQISNSLKQTQTLLSNAQAALLYKDSTTAENFAVQAQNQMPKAEEVTAQDRDLFTQTQNQLNDLKQKLEHTIEPTITSLGSLASGNTLLFLGNFLATQVGNTIVSYNLTNGSVSDSALLSSEKISSLAYIKNTTAVVYNGSGLLVWDYSKKQFSQPFTNSVPNQDSFGGIKYYSTNSRVYVLDKTGDKIISFAVAASGVGKPVVATKNANDLSNALDLAIDGSIYVLNTNGVSKYQSGTLSDFHMPSLFTPFSGKGKIATDIGWKNIYILDAGNNRILVLDKKGALVEILKSDKFTNLKDFVVDEKNKVIYVLNDNSLLKVTVP